MLTSTDFIILLFAPIFTDQQFMNGMSITWITYLLFTSITSKSPDFSQQFDGFLQFWFPRIKLMNYFPLFGLSRNNSTQSNREICNASKEKRPFPKLHRKWFNSAEKQPKGANVILKINNRFQEPVESILLENKMSFTQITWEMNMTESFMPVRPMCEYLICYSDAEWILLYFFSDWVL